MKKAVLITAALTAAAALFIFRAEPRTLTDITRPGSEAGFSVQWPELRYVLEPFSGAAEYFLSFTRYIFQLVSWMLWLAVFITAAGFAGKLAGRRIAASILKAELYLLSFAVLSLILPFPGPRLSAPKAYEITDLHSHTFYSHDGLPSPKKSLKYHKGLGFTSFFLTEHGHTDGFGKFPEKERFKTVLPGMQVSTRERVSLLILADREFEGAEFRDRPVSEVITLAHQKGFTVICPHWWKWRYFTWQELYGLGLDGFEVYNAGYRNFSRAERKELTDFCAEKGLLATGSTDWHGWGNFSNVWTAVEKTGDMNSFPFETLKNRGTVKVLVLERKGELLNTFRYMFEPFFGVYYYFSSLNRKQAFYWTLWLVLALLLRASGLLKALSLILPAALAVFFLGMGIYSLAIWVPLLPENQILGKLMAPVFICMAAGWFFALKYQTKKP